MDDAEFLRRFEACAISRADWTHRAHVKMAYLYLCEHPFPQALDLVRRGIQRLNAANNVAEGPDSGYNETTTHAFLHLVAATLAAYGEAFPTATADEFCDAHPQLLTKHVLRFFYSPERRADPRAKTQFVEPDLAPLPQIIAARDA
jgi:hypothetical protein